jgi:HD-GYP domain-containing protein (c-di-GMP phosphodiesterase class II)
MKEISVQNLPEGYYIDQPVYLDDKYILLSPDIPVTEELKKRLQEWDIPKVLSDGTPSEEPPEGPIPAMDAEDSGEGTATLESGIEEQKKRDESIRFYQDTCAWLSTVFDRYIQKNDCKIDEIADKIKEIIAKLKENKKYFLRFNDLKTDTESYLTSQSIKTTFMVLILSEVMKIPLFKQIEIGIAGILHKIGMLRIPPQIYQSGNALTAQERKAITAYPILGFRILKGLGFPMNVCRAVLEHQEKIDGSGYPRGIANEKISFYAKLIAVAGSYVAIVSDRPYREASDGHTGIMDLLKNTGHQFDEQIIRILVFTLSLYPLGTYVLLSNGSRAVVTETNSEDPRHPTVRLLMDEKGALIRERPILHTQKGGEIEIARPLTQKEIQELSGK